MSIITLFQRLIEFPPTFADFTIDYALTPKVL
jgi:hypothetical protein